MSATNKGVAVTHHRLRSRVSALRFVLGLLGSYMARDNVDFCSPSAPDPDVTLEEELADLQSEIDRSDDLDVHVERDDLERHDEFCPHGADCDDVSCELVTHANVLANMLTRAKCELEAFEAQQRHGLRRNSDTDR